MHTNIRDADFYKTSTSENNDSQHFLLLFLAALEFTAAFLQYSNTDMNSYQIKKKNLEKQCTLF